MFVVMLAMIVTTSGLLEDYAHLRCSACLVVADQIHAKLATTSAGTTTFQTTHRLGQEHARHPRHAYRGSELQAMEIIDDLCTPLTESCTLRVVNGKRCFTTDHSYEIGFSYNKEDHSNLHGISRTACGRLCEEFVARFDEEVFVEVIRSANEMTFEGVRRLLCNSTILRMCNDPNIRQHRLREKKWHEKWLLDRKMTDGLPLTRKKEIEDL